MLDLNKAACLAWLAQAASPGSAGSPPPVMPVEDHPDVALAIEAFGAALGDASGRASEAVANALLSDGGAGLRQALAQFGTARLLRLVAWIDQTDGRITDEVLRDDQSEAGRCLRATLEALNKQDLLARIFAPERLDGLLAALTQPREAGSA